MPLANRLPHSIRRLLRGIRRRIMAPVRGGMRARESDLAALVPFGFTPERPLPHARRVAVICHLFHEDLAGHFRRTMENLPGAADLFLSTDAETKVAPIRHAFAGWSGGEIDIRVLPNRGRDIGPKLFGFADIYSRYDLVLFLHSKKSLTSNLGNEWRDMLLDTLAGSPAIVESIYAIFDSHPDIGIVCSQHFPAIRELLHWDGNFASARNLARRMDLRIRRGMTIDFPSGSMFWARPAALAPLLDLRLGIEEFPPEANQLRGTPQHAVERLFLLVAEHAGYHWLKVTTAREGKADREAGRPISSPAALDDFIREARFDLLPHAVERGLARR